MNVVVYSSMFPSIWNFLNLKQMFSNNYQYTYTFTPNQNLLGPAHSQLHHNFYCSQDRLWLSSLQFSLFFVWPEQNWSPSWAWFLPTFVLYFWQLFVLWFLATVIFDSLVGVGRAAFFLVDHPLTETFVLNWTESVLNYTTRSTSATYHYSATCLTLVCWICPTNGNIVEITVTKLVTSTNAVQTVLNLF